MSVKRCSYKGCRSIQIPEIQSSETFFQFPKDEVRNAMWMTLSRCEDKSKKSVKYLCSKHFDHRKYMSSNPRRKLLLASAIPFAYQSDNEDNESYEEERVQDVVSTQQLGEEEYFTIREGLDVETTEQVVEEKEEHEIELQYLEPANSAQVEIIDQSDFKSYDQQQIESRKKLKLDNVSHSDHCKEKIQKNNFVDYVKKSPRILNHKLASSNNEAGGSKGILSTENVISKKDEGITEDNIVLDPAVTTFIFKNEEYVQMPKMFYAREKINLLKEIQYYKDIIKNFKELADNVRL